MKKIIAILIFAIALQGTASAQLGGILNKAKEKVKKRPKNKKKKLSAPRKQILFKSWQSQVHKLMILTPF